MPEPAASRGAGWPPAPGTLRGGGSQGARGAVAATGSTAATRGAVAADYRRLAAGAADCPPAPRVPPLPATGLEPANGPSRATTATPLLGSGVDLVCVPDFAAQLARPGTRFGDVFGVAETVYLDGLDQRRRAASAAARWAAKEAAVKAWSALLRGQAPVIDPDTLRWSELRVTRDAHGRPGLRLDGECSRVFTAWLAEAAAAAGWGGGARATWGVSLSHDGNYAIALVTLLLTAAN